MLASLLGVLKEQIDILWHVYEDDQSSCLIYTEVMTSALSDNYYYQVATNAGSNEGDSASLVPMIESSSKGRLPKDQHGRL